MQRWRNWSLRCVPRTVSVWWKKARESRNHALFARWGCFRHPEVLGKHDERHYHLTQIPLRSALPPLQKGERDTTASSPLQQNTAASPPLQKGERDTTASSPLQQNAAASPPLKKGG